MDQGQIVEVVMYMVPVILSITVHEYAHAMVAHRLGDDTAAMMGRLTLNPLAHIDLFGTILIPIIGILSGVPFFGWAKPVPFNPLRFTRSLRMKTSTLFVALAGPASNMLFALVLVGVGRLLFQGHEIISRDKDLLESPVFALVLLTMQVNVSLSIFNLLPVPPLDGSKILYGILPDSAVPALEILEKYSFVLFIVILMFGARLIGPPIGFVLKVFGRLMIG